jgi:hypothetical protein
MNVVASRTFERADIEAFKARSDPRQHRSRFAFRASWTADDHGARLLDEAGALPNSLSPDGCRWRGGDCKSVLQCKAS